jgi:glutamate synthase (ferredoxin)
VQKQRLNAVGAQELKALITAHQQATGSKKAQHILDNWQEYLPKFWQVSCRPTHLTQCHLTI